VPAHRSRHSPSSGRWRRGGRWRWRREAHAVAAGEACWRREKRAFAAEKPAGGGRCAQRRREKSASGGRNGHWRRRNLLAAGDARRGGGRKLFAAGAVSPATNTFLPPPRKPATCRKNRALQLRQLAPQVAGGMFKVDVPGGCTSGSWNYEPELRGTRAGCTGWSGAKYERDAQVGATSLNFEAAAPSGTSRRNYELDARGGCTRRNLAPELQAGCTRRLHPAEPRAGSTRWMHDWLHTPKPHAGTATAGSRATDRVPSARARGHRGGTPSA
jgi:hypothetical protein